jgi:mono/diheme cytochrome c family protein
MLAIRRLIRRKRRSPAIHSPLCLLTTIGLCSLFGAPAQAGDLFHDATLKRGEDIARLVCSTCHVVAKAQEFPPLLQPPAPSFEELANRPGTTVDSVLHFVTQTHWNQKTLPMTMPSPMMTNEQAAAVAHYLVSLRKP